MNRLLCGFLFAILFVGGEVIQAAPSLVQKVGVFNYKELLQVGNQWIYLVQDWSGESPDDSRKSLKGEYTLHYSVKNSLILGDTFSVDIETIRKDIYGTVLSREEESVKWVNDTLTYLPDNNWWGQTYCIFDYSSLLLQFYEPIYMDTLYTSDDNINIIETHHYFGNSYNGFYEPEYLYSDSIGFLSRIGYHNMKYYDYYFSIMVLKEYNGSSYFHGSDYIDSLGHNIVSIVKPFETKKSATITLTSAADKIVITSPQAINKLSLFDIRGRQIQALSGLNSKVVNWKTGQLAAGHYLLRIQSGVQQVTKSVLIK